MPRISFKKSEHAPVDLHEAAIVGRSEQHANVVVKDNRLSRAHCRFEPRDDGTWAVVDLESQNGTFLNGRRVKESQVKPGDVVTIGTCDMLFEATGGPGASTVMKGVASTAGGKNFGSDIQLALVDNSPESTRTVVAPAALVLVAGSLKDKIFPITHDEFKIGRKKENQLCLENDTKASGYHARIRRDGLQYFLEDLQSMNGVIVNGTKITEPVSLRPGNKVVIGLQTFEFQIQGKPAVSSGETAPKLARDSVRERAAQLAAEEAAEKAQEEPYHPTQPMAVLPDADGESVAHDKAALSQKVAKVSGGAMFGLVEVLVVVALAGGALYAAWVMMRDNREEANSEGEGHSSARAGGMLAINPSFDEKDEGGFPKGWRYEVSGTDSFGLVEGARGGPFALQIARFTPGNAVSYAVATPAETNGARGIKAAVFAVNSEYSVERYGVAVLALFWFEHPRDRDPVLVTPLAFRSRMEKWTELSGGAAVPTGARAFAVAVGVCGASGSVAFDDATADRDDNAERWRGAATAKLANGLVWDVAEDGDISVSGAEGVLLRGGRVTMHQVDGRNDPLDAMAMLAGKPTWEVTDSRIAASLDYYDPMAERRVRLNLELKAEGESARLGASLAATADGPLDGTSRRVAFHVLATPAFAPAELLRFEGDTLMEFRSEIGPQGGARKVIGTLLAANTGSGNRISAPANMLANVTALQHPQGRELFLQNNLALILDIAQGRGLDELQQLRALIADVQSGEDNVDRVNRALTVFQKFPYSQVEVAAAAAAMDSAAKDYKLKLVELRDGINVPQLTRNERLYRSAMEQAIAISTRLNAMRASWETDARVVLREIGAEAMSPQNRAVAAVAGVALAQLIAVANEFAKLELTARGALFLLEIDVQQRDAEPFLASARDFLQSGQYVQGMLKLRTVVDKYPRCLRGIEAKELLVEAAARLIEEAAEHEKGGLKNIAVDRAKLARGQLNLAESRLLATILEARERDWLSAASVAEGVNGRSWLDRELELARRIAELRAKLPKNLPPETQEGN